MARPIRPAVITPDELARIGEALYGPQWQNPLARALDINERAVRYFLSGERPVHVGIATDILMLIEDQEVELHDIAKQLRKAIKAAG